MIHIRSAMFVLPAVLSMAIVSCSSERGGEEGGDGGDGAGTATSAGVTPDPVRGYVEFAQGLQDNAAADPATIAEGLRRLAGVMGTLDEPRPELMTDLRAGAEHVLLNPGSAEVAAIVRESLMAAAQAIQSGGTSTAASARDSAERISPDEPLTAQAGAVRECFVQIAAALGATGAPGSA